MIQEWPAVPAEPGCPGGSSVSDGRPTEPEALSQRLISVLEPFRYTLFGHIDDDYEAYEKLLPRGVVAWNLSTLPENARNRMRQRVIDGLEPDERTAVALFFDEAIAFKQELFPDDSRFIREADVVREGEDFRLIVASLSLE